MRNIFTEHPSSVDETYCQHFKFACGFAGALFYAATVCFIHAIFPFLFKDTASKKIQQIVRKLESSGRCQKTEPGGTKK